MAPNRRITGSSRRAAAWRRGTLAGAVVGAVIGLLLGHRLPLTMYSKFSGPNHLYGWGAGTLWGLLLGATATAARSGSARKCTAGGLLFTICVIVTLLAPR